MEFQAINCFTYINFLHSLSYFSATDTILPHFIHEETRHRKINQFASKLGSQVLKQNSQIGSYMLKPHLLTHLHWPVVIARN